MNVDPKTAILAAQRGVLVEDRQDLGLLVATGKDRQSWLNGLVTADLAKLSAGQGRLALAVTKTGKIQAELHVLVEDSRIVVATPQRLLPALLDDLDRHLIMEKAEIADASAELGAILLHGPGSVAAAKSLENEGISLGELDSTGLGGAMIVCAPTKRDAVLARLAALPDVCIADAQALAALALELGIGTFGVDYGEGNYPQEAALERIAVSFDKGCYLGQEAVYMLEVRGHVKKKLVPLRIEGDEAPPVGTSVEVADGEVAGSITSSGISPVSGAVLAIAMLKYKHAANDASLRVLGRPAHPRQPSR